jgi:hypothetical protein
MKSNFQILSIILIFLVSCNKNKNTQNSKIHPLSPYHYKFNDTDDNLNNINYYFLSGTFEIDENLKKLLKDFIDDYSKNENDNYAYNSVYIYKETNFLNENYKGDKSSFDGRNKELIAYVRFNYKEIDIFYLLDQGNVIFDFVKNKEVDFEFEQ